MPRPSSLLIPYHLPTYELEGKSYHELPPLLQQYLTNLGIPPTCRQGCDHDVIRQWAESLREEVQRQILDLDLKLVKMKREARHRREQLQTSDDEAADEDMRRIGEIQFDLIPRRERHMNDFLAKFDALVWLTYQGPQDTLPIESVHDYRTNHWILKEVLVFVQVSAEVIDLCIQPPTHEGEFSWPWNNWSALPSHVHRLFWQYIDQIYTGIRSKESLLSPSSRAGPATSESPSSPSSPSLWTRDRSPRQRDWPRSPRSKFPKTCTPHLSADTQMNWRSMKSRQSSTSGSDRCSTDSGYAEC